MKKLLLLFVLARIAAFAQTTHSVTLTWTDTLNPSGTTYSVYRAAGPCSAAIFGLTPVASAIAVMTYLDTTVTVGNYCYVVVAVLNGNESAFSNTADAKVKPFPPGQLTIAVK